MRRVLFATLAMLCALPLQAAPRNYDLIVAGAGTGGCAAAIEAARSGLHVALLESTGWVGGQMTAAGVNTLDDLRRNRSGIYGEFLTRLRRYYKGIGVNSGICYWGSDTASGSSKVEQNILLDMLKEAGAVDIYRHTSVTAVEEKHGAVTGVKATSPSGALEFRAPVTIDATELGDLLPMTTARYRVGNSISPHINPSSSIQDITWVATINRWHDPIPDDLKAGPANEYHYMKKRLFEPVVTAGGNFWPKGYPYNVPTFNAYRAVPDPDWKLQVIGGKADTWANVTSTGLNWGNDYPGRKVDQPGLPARYLIDEVYRRKVNGAALRRTLGLLRYYQTDLGGADWTVDVRQGYAQSGDNPLNVASGLPSWAMPIVVNMPPVPYVRESRRLLGLYTLRASDIERPMDGDRAFRRFGDAIAVGEYPVDIHGSHQEGSLEKDLGESESSFPPKWHAGTFQVPLRCLVPEKLDGFLAAEKNISVSRMVNGATRLHPITMLTGQAAGALAALAVKGGVPLRDVPAALVQAKLLDDRSLLSLSFFNDVQKASADWPAAQFAAISAMTPLGKTIFGATFPVRTEQLISALDELLGTPQTQVILPLYHWASEGDLKSAMKDVALELKNWKTLVTGNDGTPLDRLTLAKVLLSASVERGERLIKARAAH